MPDDMASVSKAIVPFEINRSRGEGLPIARLPTLGTAPTGALGAQFPVDSVDGYLSVLHGVIGDMRQAYEGSIVEAAKALGATPPQAMAYARLSFMPDPANYGLMQWPGIQPESLRKVARENLLPQMIIRSRVTDLRRYSSLSTHAWSPGWRIVLKDAKRTPDKEDAKHIREAEKFVWNCSRENAYVDPRDRDAHQVSQFETFLCGSADDSMTFDGWAIWTDRDYAGRVRSFTNLPAGLIRLALPGKGYKGNPDLFAALVDETGTPAAAFTREEMTWAVRNVRNDPNVVGYGWSEIEMAVRVVQGFQNSVDLNVDTFSRNCYAEDTEVLTASGWKTFGDVDITVDTFATLNTNTGSMEYQQATDSTWCEYEGDMYWMKSRSVDLFVTPEHRIVTQYRPTYLVKGRAHYAVNTANYMFNKFQDMTPESRQNYCLPMVSTWKGVEIGVKQFAFNPPQYIKENDTVRTISGDDYCAFMGAYLSEGNLWRSGPDIKNNSVRKTGISIHQCRKSKGFKPFEELLTRILGKKPCYVEDARFSIGWKGLAEHLTQFGDDCYSKRIPDEILNATPRQQSIFWDFYVLGDGCTRYITSRNSKSPHKQEHIATTSRIMADQLQELAQKMGYAATVCKVDTSKYEGTIKGIVVQSKAIRYDVYLKTSPMQSMDLEKGSYKGMVGCVTVPNGTLYVRRNGKAAWCGNSIPNGMLLLKGDFWQQEQVDALMREWTNMKRGVSKMWGMPVVAVPEEGDVELLEFMDLKGQDVRYKDNMNMMTGIYCMISQFPVKRLGMFASGNHRDNQPVQDGSVETQGVDDPGLPALLTFMEHRINEYLLQPNWPHLRLMFMNKNPKEDARSYVERTKVRTWKESRAEADLPTLESTMPKELKPMAMVMQFCPEDPAKIGAFQSLATIMLEKILGVSDTGEDTATIGAPFPSMKDPAASQAHGHRAGVPRSASKERQRTKASDAVNE